MAAAATATADDDTTVRLSLQALTALTTNDQLRFDECDGAALLLAIASGVGGGGRRRRRVCSARCHDAAYFLLHSLLRQRASVVLCAVPLLCASLRALLDAIGALRSGDGDGGAVDVTDGRRQDVGDDEQLGCARNVRRLFEEVAEKKRALLRHGAYFLADAVAALRRPNLGAAARTEVTAGVHSILAMVGDVEKQEAYAGLDMAGRRLLKGVIAKYEESFKYKGKARF